jgi:hypothetical protein
MSSWGACVNGRRINMGSDVAIAWQIHAPLGRPRWQARRMQMAQTCGGKPASARRPGRTAGLAASPRQARQRPIFQLRSGQRRPAWGRDRRGLGPADRQARLPAHQQAIRLAACWRNMQSPYIVRDGSWQRDAFCSYRRGTTQRDARPRQFRSLTSVGLLRIYRREAKKVRQACAFWCSKMTAISIASWLRR